MANNLTDEQIRKELKAQTWLLYQGYAESQTARPIVLTFGREISLTEMRATLFAAIKCSKYRHGCNDWNKLHQILSEDNDTISSQFTGDQATEAIRYLGLNPLGPTIATVLRADDLLPAEEYVEDTCRVYFTPPGSERQYYLDVPLDMEIVASVTGDIEASQIAYNGG